MNPEPEHLVIVLEDFRDGNGDLIIDYKEIRKPIPSQMDEGTAASLALGGAALAGGFGATFSFNLILNLLLGSGLNSLIGSVKALQVIVHLLLLQVIVPANASMFFGIIFEALAFDPIDIEE